MRNISKKTRKKINKILVSDHFKKKLGVTQDTLVYTPNPESPLSAIWHHIEVRHDGTIFGYLLDDKVKYVVIGSVNRRKARQTIRSPEQFFHPRCHFARQSKQIAFRLKKMGEDKLARLFDDDAALLLIINMWNLEIEDDDFSFVTQDMIRDSGDRTEFETGAKRDIYDFLRLTATISEKLADVLNAIAECSEKVTACFMDLFEEIKGQPLEMILQKLRPDYKDRCKI